MNILIIGDSIVQGAYDRIQGGWVERFKLWGFAQEDRILIYNQGVSAHSTRELLKRIEITCQMKAFDIVIIAIGTNDSRYEHQRNNVELCDFQINLDNILTIVKQYSDKTVFVGLIKVDETKTIPVPRRSSLSYKNDYIRLYDNAIKIFTNQNGLPYISLYDLLVDVDLDDGLHPNAMGHQKIFERVLDELHNIKYL